MVITPDEASQLVFKFVRPLPAASLSLAKAAGHCLAKAIRADRDQPPTDRSAMDGFALRAADLQSGGDTLRLVGESAAGGGNRLKVTRGTCVRILTGAVVPPGADTVIPLEVTSEDGDCITFDAPASRGDNIRKRGEEIRKGAVLVPGGSLLGAIHIGLCASAGHAEVRVHRRPRAMVLCTGQELRPARAAVKPHQIRNSNGPALCAAIEAAGLGKVANRIVRDDPGAITAAIAKAAAEVDVVIVTGGVSVGKYDFVPAAARAAGATERFHGVSMKPGKPQMYATFSGNRHLFGLPGNPLSVLTGFHEFVLPAMRRLAGVAVGSCRPELHLPLADAVRSRKPRTEYVVARVETRRGVTRVRPLASHGSADLAAACEADGVIPVPPKTQHATGDIVTFRPWGPMR